VADSWTPRELDTLAAVAETFVRGDAVRRARLTREALDQAADPSQIGQLRLVLRLMESRLANLVLARRPRRFAGMSPPARQRYLLTWANSPLALRRTAFASLRKLLTFLAYADPGVDAAGNPRHAVIGYEPEYPPVTQDRTPIRPYTLAFGVGGPNEATELEADVVVVGSGAGGGVVAAAAAEAGRSVVVLEAGPFVDEGSMPRDELAAYERLYLNRGLLATWDGAVTMLAGGAVGGGTLINWMTSIEAPAAVREEWAMRHGIDGIRDGEAWTDDVTTLELELRVTEVDHPPPKDRAILAGCERLGWDAAPVRRNAIDCRDCGSCPFGCRRGTKQSGIRVHLARAAEAGARIVPQVRVTRVLVERGRAVGVEGEALIPGATPARTRPVVVRAPQVVLAAGALRSPAILQASRIGHHPAVGKHLRIHPVPVVAGFLPSPVDMWRGPLQAARSMQFAADAPGRRGYIIESAPGHPGLLALALPWDGFDDHAATMHDVRAILPLIAITRDGGEGRVTRTRAGNVRVDYALDKTGVATVRHATVRMARLARAAGAGEILVCATPGRRFRPVTISQAADDAAFERFIDELERIDVGSNRTSLFSAHQMGTLRMGTGRRDHVCDPAGRVRGGGVRNRVVAGLYVADASLFPTGIGVNPTLTVMALARRVSRTVLAETPTAAG
jgi:choline dehydrogenase-like flavoprotein